MSERSQPVLATMFVDQGDAFSVSSPHTGLLWALETVAWSSEHAALAANLLARLAEIDPGGRLSNRPMSSLEAFFRPWLPQTSLSAERRLAVLDALRRDHEQVAWTLMLKLLPEQHAVGNHSSSPRFRSWKPEEEGVTPTEFWEFSSAVARRLLEAAGREPARWLELVIRIADLPPPERADALIQLSGLAGPEAIDPGLREELWGELDKLIRQHRTFARAKWALPPDEIDQIGEVAKLFAPTDPVAAVAWLFDEHFPDLGTERGDYHEQEAEVDRSRVAAVEHVLAAGGFEELLRLVASVQYPAFAGRALAANATGERDERIIPLLGHEDMKRADFASGYSFRRARSEGLAWIRSELDQLAGSPLAQARLLQVSDDLPEIWRIATGLGADVEEAYWREFATFGRGPDFALVNEAAGALMKFARPIAALDLMGLYVRNAENRVAPALVVEALQQLVRLPEDHPEHQRLSHYELEGLLEYLRQSDISDDTLGVLEWQLLPALGFDARSPTLERRLARDPRFFVDILSLVYRPRGSETNAEHVPEHVASNAYHLLEEWKIVPGSDDRLAEVDENELLRWVSEAQTLLTDANRREVGDVHIGKVLAHARPDNDDTWPTRPVRNLIEATASPEIEDGFSTQTFNNRGGTSRGLLDGGAQERELAAWFRDHADRIRDEWPRTAAVLTSLAKGYEREGLRHDEDVERFRQGMER